MSKTRPIIDNDFDVELRTLIVRTLLFSPLVFGMFHFFIFSLWYYRSIGPTIPIVLSTSLMLLCFHRLGLYVPLPRPAKSKIPLLLSRVFPSRIRPLGKFSSLAEIVFWYGLLIGLYLHLHIAFDFPRSLEGTSSWIPLLLGYAAFFAVAFTINPLMYWLGDSIRKLVQELQRFRLAIRRLGTVLSTFFLLNLMFGAVYQLISVHNPLSFDPPLKGFADAFYFSTLTITVLGGADSTPQSPTAKMLAACETLAGILFLAAVLAFILSMPLEDKSQKE